MYDYLHLVIFSMIVIAIILVVILIMKKIITKIIASKRNKIIQKQENRENEKLKLADSCFLQAGNISTAVLKQRFLSAIYNYIVVKNDNMVNIPNEFQYQVSDNIIRKILEERQRYKENNYYQTIVNFELNEHLKITPINNGTVQMDAMQVRARYLISIINRHSSLEKQVSEKREIYFVFKKSANEQWKIDSIEKEEKY